MHFIWFIYKVTNVGNSILNLWSSTVKRNQTYNFKYLKKYKNAFFMIHLRIWELIILGALAPKKRSNGPDCNNEMVIDRFLVHPSDCNIVDPWNVNVAVWEFASTILPSAPVTSIDVFCSNASYLWNNLFCWLAEPICTLNL